MHQMSTSFSSCHYFDRMHYVCVIGIRSWAKAEAVARRDEVSKAKCREQSPAAPTAHQGPGEATSEGDRFVTDCLLITFSKYLLFKNVFNDLKIWAHTLILHVPSRIWRSFRKRGSVWRNSTSRRWISSTKSCSRPEHFTTLCRRRQKR